jgi:hypothetical protein
MRQAREKTRLPASRKHCIMQTNALAPGEHDKRLIRKILPLYAAPLSERMLGRKHCAQSFITEEHGLQSKRFSR